MNLFILAAIVLAALKLWKNIAVSWTIIAIIAGAGVLIPLFSGATSGLGGLLGGNAPGPAATRDACGCQPGQRVSVAKKGLFGYKNKAVLPCADALILLSKRKYHNFGCVNT